VPNRRQSARLLDENYSCGRAIAANDSEGQADKLIFARLDTGQVHAFQYDYSV